MTVVSHFRFPKVQQVSLASLFRTDLTFYSNEAVLPKHTSGPGTRLNFGFYGRNVYPSPGAFSGPHLIKRKATGSSAPAGATPGSIYLVHEGGVA